MASIAHALETRAEEVPKGERRRLGLARTLRRVAILGAGTMGARIAAHFANAGVASLLMSRTRPNEPNRSITAQKALDALIKQKPAAFFVDSAARLVKAGNFDDHLAEIAGCDWVIETVAEDLQIKRELWHRVEAVVKPGTILSTCTSGIPLAKIAEDFTPQFRHHFLGTHFFNPPRYLHLLEVIPGPETDPEVMSFVEEYSDRRLGKGVVLCKDSPSFIANRIGAFFGSTACKVMMEDGYTIEEVDALTGSLIGLPNSASFRLLDLVGLDIWVEVGPGIYANCPDDPWRDRLLIPEFQKQMVANKWLGEKTGQGFYKKVVKGEEKEIWAIDWKTLEYHLAQKPKWPSVDAANIIEDLPERLRTIMVSNDRAGKFLWKVFSDYFIYSASMIPEISDRIVDIDRAMKWGYAHKFGPFEYWDALGFREVCHRLTDEGRVLPHSVQEALDAGATSLYRFAEGDGHRAEFFDFIGKEYKPVDARPGAIALAGLKRSQGVVKKNAGASLVDVGDGVLCCEFHSKMNAIGEDIINMLYSGLEETNRNFEAMVIANEGENFCVGANLVGILLAAQEGEWDELTAVVNRIQHCNLALK